MIFKILLFIIIFIFTKNLIIQVLSRRLIKEMKEEN